MAGNPKQSPPFADRREGGRMLGQMLEASGPWRDPLVLGLPRGGVPVAAEVARALGAELDVVVVRKLGAPRQPELAIGAIAWGGERVVNEAVVGHLGITPDMLEEITTRERIELERRERMYRGERPLPTIGGRDVVIVDDGIATGASMRAAIVVVAGQRPARLVVAAPIGPEDACRDVGPEVDLVALVVAPEGFGAVGEGYRDFSQVRDDEVREILARGW
jgi:putative phosphoribosyl transferase